MHATRAAVEEGIVAGGGVALLRAPQRSRSCRATVRAALQGARRSPAPHHHRGDDRRGPTKEAAPAMPGGAAWAAWTTNCASSTDQICSPGSNRGLFFYSPVRCGPAALTGIFDKPGRGLLIRRREIASAKVLL